MVERLAIFSWNSGWYDAIVDGLVYTYVMTNRAIKAEDGKVHLYKVIEWISAGKVNSRYEKVAKLDIDYSYEVALEDVGSTIVKVLIALGFAAIAFTILIKTVGPATLGGLIGGGIILLILLLLVLREVR